MEHSIVMKLKFITVLIQYYSTYSVLYRLVGRLGFSSKGYSASYSIVIALRLFIFMCRAHKFPTGNWAWYRHMPASSCW